MFGKQRTIKFDFTVEEVMEMMMEKLQKEGRIPDGDYYVDMVVKKDGPITMSFGAPRK